LTLENRQMTEIKYISHTVTNYGCEAMETEL
jgi:hypothetical protein